MGVLDPFRFVVISMAGWVNQQQRNARTIRAVATDAIRQLLDWALAGAK